MTLRNVVISKDNREKALVAINKLDNSKHTSLKMAFNIWRYIGADKEDGSFVVREFTGEKLGVDSYLWKAVAPFVSPSAEIECFGENGRRWKWVFDNGKFQEKKGKVVWK